VEEVRVPVEISGQHIGDLHARPGTDPELLARAMRQLAGSPAWAQLGADLAALGPQRLSIAARAARAAAGGRGVNAEEAERIAQWFDGIIDEAIRRGGLPAAVAIAWLARVAFRATGEAASVTSPGANDTASECARPEADAARSHDPASHACALVHHAIALEAAGWHVTELRPSGTDELALWRVTIERYDQAMTMSVRDAVDPDAAIEELVRYAQVDAS
jgi:hypothetical protein